MKVRARVANASALTVEQRGHSIMATSEYDLTVGKTYDAACVGMFEGELTVLVTDDYGQPDWYPAVLFDLADGSLPSHWVMFMSSDAEGGWSFRLGYPELANSLEHVNGLIEHDPDALDLFYRRAGAPTPPQT